MNVFGAPFFLTPNISFLTPCWFLPLDAFFLTLQFFSLNLLYICFRPPNISFLTLGSKKNVFFFFS